MSCSGPMLGGKHKGGLTDEEQSVLDKSGIVGLKEYRNKQSKSSASSTSAVGAPVNVGLPPLAPRVPVQQQSTSSGVNAAGNGGRRITRKAHWRYIRGIKIHMPARRIKDVGAKGKWTSKHGPGIGELTPGGLMGYTPAMSKTARHTKLRKVVKSKGALSTFRKLNALATYTKRTAKGKSKTAKADRNWVKKTYM